MSCSLLGCSILADKEQLMVDLVPLLSQLPGPGFLLLMVPTRGPVTIIFSLLSPKLKPFLGLGLYSSEKWQELGGGQLGSSLVKSYLLPQPKAAPLLERVFLSSQYLSQLYQKERYRIVLRLRKRGCLGKEQSILAEELLVGALQIQLQLEIVTDMSSIFYYQFREQQQINILSLHGAIKFKQSNCFHQARGVLKKCSCSNMTEDWAVLLKFPEFHQQVIYNPDYIDCHLSPRGKDQCLEPKEQLKDFSPDLIICSPLQRALETTRIVFPGQTCPHIVQPLLSQTLKHSSEVCRSIEVKKTHFTEFDFSRVEAQGQFWFIKNDSYENQQKYFKFLEDIHFQGIQYKEQVHRLTQFMRSHGLRQKQSNVRQRARKVKQLLKQYSQKYQKIAVVSHFFTIKYLNATDFDEKDEPINKVHMKNCGTFTTNIQQLTKNT